MSQAQEIAQRTKDTVGDERTWKDTAKTVMKYGSIAAAIGIGLTVLTIGGLLSVPVILFTAPVWIPALILFTVVAGFLLFTAVAAYLTYYVSYIAYKWWKGEHTPETDKIEMGVEKVKGTFGYGTEKASRFGQEVQGQVFGSQ